MKKILITGVSGFAGSFLAEHLLTQPDNQLFGTSLSGTFSPQSSHLAGKVSLVKVDLQNYDQITKIIAEVRPDEIYHLAALAAASLSFSQPAHTLVNNITSELNLLEAVRFAQLLQTKILIVSSADVYGNVDPSQLPVNESTPFNPTNPYAVSKIAQDFLGLQYFHTYHMPIVRVRPFNHIGPRQAPHFVVPDFAKQIAEIEKGEKEQIIRVGNVDAKRDFSDVRDIVRAYVLLLEKGIPGEVYNVGSGVSHPISFILNTLLSLSTTKITVEKDPTKMRPADNPELVCDITKITSATGWKPTVPLEETLKNTLDYWRNIQ